jgi:hypothetical protein
MKGFGISLIILILMLTPLFLIGCSKTTVVDGVELSNVKIIVVKDKDSKTNREYRTANYSCVVKNITEHSLEFTVMFIYRWGSILSPSVQIDKKEIILSPGESKTLMHTTSKIYGGILDEKKIKIQNVKNSTNTDMN